MSHGNFHAAPAAQPAAVAAGPGPVPAAPAAAAAAAPAAAPGRNARSANFVGVANFNAHVPPCSWPAFFQPYIDRGELRSVCGQAERGDEGVLHWHFYIQLPAGQQKSVSSVARMFALIAPHVEIRRGTHAEAVAYNTKDEHRVEGPWALGQQVQGPGQRTDLESVARDVYEGRTSVAEVAANAPALFVKQFKGLQALQQQRPAPERQAVAVLAIVGPTSVGKTWNVRRSFGNDIYVPLDGNSGNWFDAYTGQRVLLLDEFKGTVRLQTFLRLCEQYSYKADAKHAWAWAAWTFVIVISNSPPTNWWQITRKDAAGNDVSSRADEMDAVFARIGLGPRPRVFGATIDCYSDGISTMDAFRAAFVAKINELRGRVHDGVHGSDLIPQPANWPAAPVAAGPGVAPAPLPPAPAAVPVGDAPAAIIIDDQDSGSSDGSAQPLPDVMDDSSDSETIPPLKRRHSGPQDWQGPASQPGDAGTW